LGVIAQEIQDILDKDNKYDIVKNTKQKSEFGDDDVLTINYQSFIPVLIKAVQQLSKENDELKDKISNLETQVKNCYNLITKINAK
jgi:flagellar biosynthesis chaperone FliJ